MYADLVIQICNIQLSVSQKIPTIPPIQPSPLVCGGKMAISVCSIILHCQKYHFLSWTESGFEDLSGTQSLPFSAPPVQKNKTTLHQVVAQKELKQEKILKPSC